MTDKDSTSTDYRQFIVRELDARRESNPQYSLRAFARDLKLSPSMVSEIINRKAGLSSAKAQTLAKLLGLEKEEASLFQDMVKMSHARDKRIRDRAEQRVLEKIENPKWQIDSDRFEMISDWQYLATLELANLPGKVCTHDEIVRRFLVSPQQAQQITERLVRLGYLKEDQDRFIATKPGSSTDSKVPSKAIRNFHRQILNEAIDSIEGQSIDQRHLQAAIVSIAEDQIPEAKKMIQQFTFEFARKLRSKRKNKKVYNISVQFFNLEKGMAQ